MDCRLVVAQGFPHRNRSEIMESIAQTVSLIGIAVTVVLTLVMLFTFRKDRPIKPRTLLLSALVSLVMLPVLMLLTRTRLNPVVALPALALGLLVGGFRGRTTKLVYRDGIVVGRNSMFFLLGWAAGLLLAQAMNVLGSALLSSLGIIPLFLSTGTQVGMSGDLLVRRLRLKPR